MPFSPEAPVRGPASPVSPFPLRMEGNQPFLSGSPFFLQLALRGPAGPMGLTGRPGPMVSHPGGLGGGWGLPLAIPCLLGSGRTRSAGSLSCHPCSRVGGEDPGAGPAVGAGLGALTLAL